MCTLCHSSHFPDLLFVRLHFLIFAEHSARIVFPSDFEYFFRIFVGSSLIFIYQRSKWCSFLKLLLFWGFEKSFHIWSKLFAISSRLFVDPWVKNLCSCGFFWHILAETERVHWIVRKRLISKSVMRFIVWIYKFLWLHWFLIFSRGSIVSTSASSIVSLILSRILSIFLNTLVFAIFWRSPKYRFMNSTIVSF